VANYCISVREVGDDIVFLRKVVRGAVDRSYGIQVARLAGLPPRVVERARSILYELEGQAARREASAARDEEGRQLALFEAGPSPIEEELLEIDVMNLTPLEALNRLHRLQERARKRKG